jgi:DNA-binding NarL/FixJ family response regulator
MIKIYILDNAVYRKGLVSIISDYPEFEVVGEATNTLEALPDIEDHKPDVVILDAFRTDGDGMEAIASIKERSPESKTLILTQSQNESDCLKAMKAGARGYLPKSIEAKELVECVRLVASGSALIFTPKAANILNGAGLMNNGRDKNGGSGLSSREKEILEFVAQGVSTKGIAAHCFVSETTIKAHLRKIMEKLDARNRAQAVAKAIEKGVLINFSLLIMIVGIPSLFLPSILS